MFGKSNRQLIDEQPAQPGATPEKPEAISNLGPGMAIIGKIDCEGTLNLFGRIEGELRATNVLIGNGAQFDGSIIAQGVTIDGRLKGIIHATRVSLKSNAVVDGDIFHRVLSIDANAQFEGSSRRVENPADSAANALTSDWGKAKPIDGLPRRVESPADSAPNPLNLDWSKAKPIRLEDQRHG